MPDGSDTAALAQTQQDGKSATDKQTHADSSGASGHLANGPRNEETTESGTLADTTSHSTDSTAGKDNGMAETRHAKKAVIFVGEAATANRQAVVVPFSASLGLHMLDAHNQLVRLTGLWTSITCAFWEMPVQADLHMQASNR